jgi:two-component sensor histidine kinase
MRVQGCGDGFDSKRAKGLGMKIVQSLEKQIGGEFGFGLGADRVRGS